MNPVTPAPTSRNFFQSCFFKNFLFFSICKIRASESNGVKRLIPNALSFLRIIFFVVVADLFSQGFLPLALIAFCLAVATDFLDGFLARFFRVTSAFGAILDPLADKILYLGSLWALRDFAPTILVFLLTLPSEVMLMTIRFPPLKNLWKAKIPATWIGKIKAGIQFSAIIVMIFGLIIERRPIIYLGIGSAFGAIILSWASLYSHCNWKNKAV